MIININIKFFYSSAKIFISIINYNLLNIINKIFFFNILSFNCILKKKNLIFKKYFKFSEYINY